MTGTRITFTLRQIGAVSALALLGACADGVDIDLRGGIGNNFDTSSAAQDATQSRPKPDENGIISYPNYQVAVARRGDSVSSVAARVGLTPAELARFNGLLPDDSLRRGEILALPRRVELGADNASTLAAPDDIDITELAGNAIEGAQDTTPKPKAKAKSDPKPDLGPEPVRHKVARGETVYTLSRLYKVSVRSIADWNALDRDFTVREGQYLLIPVVEPTGVLRPEKDKDVSQPGEGSSTPQPPSAKKPLPKEPIEPLAPEEAKKPAVKAPEIGQDAVKQTKSTAQMTYPVSGSVIRAYAKGKNDGIDISGQSGAAVKAAASGVVAAITRDSDNLPIVVIKHPNNLLTVYSNIDGVQVKKDDSVSRGQTIGKLRSGGSAYVHFEVRRGFDSVDPLPFLQ